MRLALFGIAASLVAALRRSVEQERALARTGHVTGAANGRAFPEAAEAEIRRAARDGPPLSVAYLDLDGLELVTDRARPARTPSVPRELTLDGWHLWPLALTERLGVGAFVVDGPRRRRAPLRSAVRAAAAQAAEG